MQSLDGVSFADYEDRILSQHQRLLGEGTQVPPGDEVDEHDPLVVKRDQSPGVHREGQQLVAALP